MRSRASGTIYSIKEKFCRQITHAMLAACVRRFMYNLQVSQEKKGYAGSEILHTSNKEVINCMNECQHVSDKGRPCVSFWCMPQCARKCRCAVCECARVPMCVSF